MLSAVPLEKVRVICCTPGEGACYLLYPWRRCVLSAVPLEKVCVICCTPGEGVCYLLYLS